MKWRRQFLYDPSVGRFLSPDNIIQDPTSTQNFNRYSYCLNNPLKYTDPSGNTYKEYMDNLYGEGNYWYRGQAPGTWGGEGSHGGGGSATGRGPTYGAPSYEDWARKKNAETTWVQLGFFYRDKDGNPIIKDEFSGVFWIYEATLNNYSVNSTTGYNLTTSGRINDYPGGNYLRNSNVSVTFDPNSDNLVNPKLSVYFNSVMTKASAQGIRSVNISCTTVHPSNATRSAHTIANGARALDINYINGVHVSTSNPYVNDLQNIIKSTPGYMENYGPLIINKVSNGMVIQAPWAREIKGGHYDHIHISIPW